MDDQSYNSPPSSRKSSVVGKLDRPETPNRGSPYLTRSRRSSTLTEENIALHNDTPTTTSRRITRRMSQSNENGVTLTPMPQTARRTRRSPSVNSDDLISTPKKKFTVAQENVVIEEDEPMEENKQQSTGADTNETKIENDGEKENSNKIVNGNATEETQELKSKDANKTGSMVEQPMEPKVITHTVTIESDEVAVLTSNSNTVPVPVDITASPMIDMNDSTKTAEAINGDVSTTPNNTSELLDNNLTVNAQAAVTINQQAQPGSIESSESSFHADRKSTSETNELENSVPTTASPQLNDTSVIELNQTVVEIKTPAKLTGISASDVIVITETPDSSIILVPDTPVQKPITETPVQTKLSSTTDDSAISKIVPSIVQSVQVGSPKTPVQVKTAEISGRVTRQSILKTQQVVPSAPSVQQVDSPKTPVQTKNSDVSLDAVTPVTPVVIQKSVPVTQQVDSVASPKTPLKTKNTSDVNTPATVLGTTNKVVDGMLTPNSNMNFVNVTTSEEEILLKTPSPAKPTAELKSNADDAKNAPSVDDTPKLEEAKTALLQNGSLSENDKVDGKSIDNLETDELKTETASSKGKPTKKNISTVQILDSSDEESCDDAESNSANESRNMFLDDEAMESCGEESMDEEERKYLKENEIPEDGISLGSESDEAMSEEEESDDSFVVSDSSVQLLDGSGDDLGLENNLSKRDRLVNKRKRINKIVDTSDEESAESPKKSAKKRRPETSLKSTAKYLRVDDDEEEEDAEQNDLNESSDKNELANLDAEPKSRRSSKRLSEATSSPSKKDKKRLSLHPNMKFSSLESGAEESNVNKNDSLEADDNSEEDITEVLANLDEEPKRASRSKRFSESLESSKKDFKRKSLHPNTKLSAESISKENKLSVDLNRDEKQTTEESGPTTVDESNTALVEEEQQQPKADKNYSSGVTVIDQDEVEDELANLDSEPKTSKDKKRLSEVSSRSKKEMKRMSLHPNTKLSSNDQEQEHKQEQQSEANENDSTGTTATSQGEKGVEDELANLDDEPKIIGKSKRLSDVVSPSKNNTKRLSLHPNAKLNRSGFDFKAFASTITSTVTSAVEEISSTVPKTDGNEKSAPAQQKMDVERSVEEIQAKCDEVLQKANEARRVEKLNKQPMQDDKYQRLKEKKAAKLQEKQRKEARELEREAQAAKQRQLKRDKKSKIAEVTEQEKQQAIQKAIDFSEKIKAKKIKHSMVSTESSSLNESTELESSPVKTSKRKRKPKRLQILNEGSNQPEKKRRVADTEHIPAKPEGFKTSSIAVTKKIKQKRQVVLPEGTEKVMKAKGTGKGSTQITSAGSFEIESFTVTSLQSKPDVKVVSFKDEAILNSNVKRVSAIDLLNIKKMKLKKK